ncbi:unnamed protein product, partial [Discosporangium mesarthrocarpum]
EELEGSWDGGQELREEMKEIRKLVESQRTQLASLWSGLEVAPGKETGGESRSNGKKAEEAVATVGAAETGARAEGLVSSMGEHVSIVEADLRNRVSGLKKELKETLAAQEEFQAQWEGRFRGVVVEEQVEQLLKKASDG